MSAYWEQLAQARLSRRRALASTVAGASFAAATLAGCGGDDDDEEQASGLVSKAIDTSGRAERGGIFKNATLSDTSSFAPIEGTTESVRHAAYVYSRLLKFRVGILDKPADGSTEADAAESFEVSSDGLQYTFHLRGNLPYDARPPTSGRALDSADVKFSWERLVAIGRTRADLANSVSAEAPVVSVATPDARTVVFKLAFPYAPFPSAMASPQHLFILPVEAEGKFDPKTDMRGSGAWFLSKYTPSVGFEYRRNPNWYVKDRPFLDGWDLPIISEYAQGVAQLKAGVLCWYNVRQTDVVQTKRDVPGLRLLKYKTGFPRWGPLLYFGLDARGKGAGTPFLDDRVRKAMSMLIDRDLWIDTFYGVSEFAKDGLPLETRWHSHVFAGEEAWLDPQARELGEAARFFKHDPGEARKLLRAAGHTSAVPGEYTYSTASNFGADFPKQAEVLRQMFQANGDFDLRVNNPTFNDLVTNYGRSKGNFSGVVMSALPSITDIDPYLYSSFHSSGRSLTFPPGDPEMDRLVDSQRRETDNRKRAEIIKQFQKYAASKFYTILSPGHSLGYDLSWPWFGNRVVFNGWDIYGLPQEVNVHAWYDKAKKTA